MYKVSSKIIKKVQKNVFFLRKVTVNLIQFGVCFSSKKNNKFNKKKLLRDIYM